MGIVDICPSSERVLDTFKNISWHLNSFHNYSEYESVAVNVAPNAIVSSQYVYDVFTVFVSKAYNTQIMVQMPIVIHQSGVTRPTHKREHTAAITADIECTLFSRSEDRKAGAVPTNAIAAGARNARN
jgi:hypothetical protein